MCNDQLDSYTCFCSPGGGVHCNTRFECGATVCRTHLRLDRDFAFHCDGNYVCTQILGAYIIS